MFKLVKTTKEMMVEELVRSLYKEDLFAEMLVEQEEVAAQQIPAASRQPPAANRQPCVPFDSFGALWPPLCCATTLRLCLAGGDAA
jgi:hypothetical protein